MKKKYCLLTPGPTNIPEEIRQLSALPIIHHRTDDFNEIYKNCMKNLQYVFQTKNPVYIMLSSGTGAMEAAIINFLNFNDTILVINAGKFGERWQNIAQKYNIQVIELIYKWGEGYDINDIKKALEAHPEIKAVYTQLCETSTGVIMDIRPLGLLIKNMPQLLIVDAISGLGAVEFYMDKWHVDITVSASQKALMTPPGLSFISMSKKAKKAMEKSLIPKFYFDLKKYIKSGAKFSPPFTPHITGVIQLNRALSMIRKTTLKNNIKKHKVISHAVREAIKAMGLHLLNDTNKSNVCTSVFTPPSIDAKEFLQMLKNKYLIVLAPGQGEYKHKMFRIGHLGYITPADIICGLTGIADALLFLKFPAKKEKALKTAYKLLKRLKNSC